MRLSQIKLAGFKSFVDATHIHTPGQIVGIVGPNGCGKSNIIDALRWVLGESRAQALRGDSMQDVIFSGSSTRKPVSRASVELIFDNSQRHLSGQWSQYAEISVKRVLQRDSESSYFLNNTKVRKRDIADLFMGTGLGARAYAIIEQGMISRIIEANPQELRVFLEEAAGISKYKERKKETEHRLADARDNLLRVNDVCTEIAAQIEHLTEQSAKAKKYRELNERRLKIQQLLWFSKKMAAQLQKDRFAKEASRLEIEIERETAKLRNYEALQAQMASEFDQSSDALHEAQASMYQANAEVASLEQKIQHLEAQKSRVTELIGKAEAEIESLKKQEEEAENSLTTFQAQWSTAEKLAVLCQKEKTDEEGNLALLESELQEKRQLLVQAQHLLSQQEKNEKVEEAHFNHCLININQLEKKLENLYAEKMQIHAFDEEKLCSSKALLADTCADIAHRKALLDSLLVSLAEEESALKKMGQEAVQKEKDLAQVKARHDALHELNHEKDENLSLWLEERALDRLPKLWSTMRIEEKWEAALESALGEKINAFLVDDLDFLRREKPPGEIVFLKAKEGTPAASTPRSLSDFIEWSEPGFGHAARQWLDKVFVVNDLDEALDRLGELKAGEMFVTPQGHKIDGQCIHWHFPNSKSDGVLARNSEIARLKEAQDEILVLWQEAKARIMRKEKRLSETKANVDQLRSDILLFENKRHALELECARLLQEKENLGSRVARIDRETRDFEKEHLGDKERLSQIESALKETRQKMADLKGLWEMARSEVDAVEAAVREKRNRLQEKAKRAQEAGIAELHGRNSINEANARIGFLRGALLKNSAELDSLKKEFVLLDGQELREGLQLALKNLEEKETLLRASREKNEDRLRQSREMDQSRHLAEQSLIPLRELLSEAKLKWQEAKISIDQLTEMLAGADEKELSLQKIKASAADISALDREIEALGAVNLAALEELEAAEKRKSYLDAQCLDLNKAVETLEAAILRIDRETREKLKNTFDEVNRHLSGIFPQLFGGGQAKLYFTGDSIIDSGIEITAQPPGKKNASIHLLSGGEKALTALSLVFSLFQMNPAPFCLLDEVDAPLDDSNAVRFCDMVVKMSQHTQFLFISHNKISMEMAKQLIGVTMQEQGVSRIVAVDIREMSHENKV